MRVILTGGAGYIGSHTLVELLTLGHEPWVIDDFSNSLPEALARVRRITGRDFGETRADVRDRAAMRQIFESFRPEAVIHFAGLKAVGEGEAEPLRYYDVNVGGTLSLLEAMTAVGCKRVIFSSSATVYGDPVYLPYDEAHPCAPTNVYGRTKHMAEEILRDWARATPDASSVLLRYFNPVGAHDSGLIGEDPQGIPNNLMPFLAQVAVGRRAALGVFGDDYATRDGTGERDYLHVGDLARAHVAALDHATKTQGTEVFNIGTGRGTTVLEMLHAFSAACGRELPHEILPRRPGDLPSYYADPTKAATVLGWQAQHDLAEICASSWRWQARNPQGYRTTEQSTLAAGSADRMPDPMA